MLQDERTLDYFAKRITCLRNYEKRIGESLQFTNLYQTAQDFIYVLSQEEYYLENEKVKMPNIDDCITFLMKEAKKRGYMYMECD